MRIKCLITGLFLMVGAFLPQSVLAQDQPALATLADAISVETPQAVAEGLTWQPPVFAAVLPHSYLPQSSHPPTTTLASQVQAGPEPAPPMPEHTGFGALVRTIGSDFVAFPKRQSTWVILGIGGGAALLAHPADDNLNSHLTGSAAVSHFFAAGKWIGSAPVQIGASVGLYVVGRYIMPHMDGEPKTNKVSHLGYDLLRAQIVSQAFVQGIKIAVRRDRPDGTCCAFPSGHAATAFAVASVLERHLGYRAAWPTLVIASYVAISRLHENVHVLSDVIFGSALGMATGWTIVGRHGRDEYALLPTRVPGGFAISLSRTSRSR